MKLDLARIDAANLPPRGLRYLGKPRTLYDLLEPFGVAVVAAAQLTAALLTIFS